MEAALRLSLYGVGLLGALRQSLLASMAVSLVVGVLKKTSFSPAPRRVSSHPPTHRLRQSFSRDAPSQASFSRRSGALSITVRQSR